VYTQIYSCVCVCTQVYIVYTYMSYRAVHECRQKVNFVMCVHTAVLVLVYYGGWWREQYPGPGGRVGADDKFSITFTAYLRKIVYES
jgi:hypothetical protein